MRNIVTKAISSTVRPDLEVAAIWFLGMSSASSDPMIRRADTLVSREMLVELANERCADEALPVG